ncbi:hypothetical protein QE152_g32713 [Popillia japonica]|uniref:Uncharacterized protein n=1 Tax=Popillia japonica TaxID=7064 RepID=A0AAW1IYJ6_POPJA
MRLAAKQYILKIQEENRKSFNSKRKEAHNKRKEAHKYRIGDVVAIKRTQFATQGKFKSKFLGPYKITAVRAHDRYDVEKLGNVEGPYATSTAADFMKPWAAPVEHYDDSSEEAETVFEDETSRNGRVVGFQNDELVAAATDNATSSVRERQKREYETRYGGKKHVVF